MEIPESIEQLPPNKPNFPLIVALFVVAIVAILLCSYLFVRRAAMHTPDGKKTTSSLQQNMQPLTLATVYLTQTERALPVATRVAA